MTNIIVWQAKTRGTTVRSKVDRYSTHGSIELCFTGYTAELDLHWARQLAETLLTAVTVAELELDAKPPRLMKPPREVEETPE